MSPKVVRMTPGWCVISMARSTSSFAVTQTGQPGPDRSVTVGGMTRRMPCFAMATVCVPQTSISFAGLVEI